MQTYNYLFKSILIGDSNVGKSALLRQFSHGQYNSLHELTIGVELDYKVLNIKDKEIKLHIWDTAGLERFHAITRTYFKNCCIIYIVFDICKRESFENAITIWLTSVKNHCHPKCTFVLVGNKCDLKYQRQVTNIEVLNKIRGMDMTYIEVSSKTALNVEYTFISSVKDVLQKIPSLSDKERKELGIVQGENEKLNGIHPSDLHGPSPSCCVIH